MNALWSLDSVDSVKLMNYDYMWYWYYLSK
jgi:hypothetical protein